MQRRIGVDGEDGGRDEEEGAGVVERNELRLQGEQPRPDSPKQALGRPRMRASHLNIRTG